VASLPRPSWDVTYGWKAAIPAYIGAIYIAAARVDGNKHYLSDVVFGAAMGLAGTRTVVLKPGRYGVQLVPAVTPDQVALSLALVPWGADTVVAVRRKFPRGAPVLRTATGRLDSRASTPA
jgi:hypothetical protein